MSIEADPVLTACISLSCKLKERSPREMQVITHDVVQPVAATHTLQLDLGALQAVATAIALGVEPSVVDLERAEEVMVREGSITRLRAS
jgi:hypothetical protein